MKERLARTVWFTIEQLKIYAPKITKYLSSKRVLMV